MTCGLARNVHCPSITVLYHSISATGQGLYCVRRTAHHSVTSGYLSYAEVYGCRNSRQQMSVHAVTK